jgi:hypothetical protein
MGRKSRHIRGAKENPGIEIHGHGPGRDPPGIKIHGPKERAAQTPNIEDFRRSQQDKALLARHGPKRLVYYSWLRNRASGPPFRGRFGSALTGKPMRTGPNVPRRESRALWALILDRSRMRSRQTSAQHLPRKPVSKMGRGYGCIRNRHCLRRTRRARLRRLRCRRHHG